MKIILFIGLLLNVFHGISQSVISKTIVRDHRHGGVKEEQIFKITSLLPIYFTDRFATAFRQSDVIGNDFYAAQRIGTAYAYNHWYEKSDYNPIDGYKRTFTGKGYMYEFYPGEFDDDLTVYIESFDPLITQYSSKINSYGELSEESINIIEGEVDVHDVVKKYYKSPYPIPTVSKIRENRRFADNISLYGAWVIEEGSLGKKNNHEIHPLEQFWWRDDGRIHSLNSVDYYLNLAVDNSGRFESRDDFDNDGELVKPWGESPLDGVFAIQFEVDRQKKETLVYTLNKIYSKNASAPINDPKIHHLIIDNDTLISVVENMSEDLISIDFNNVGYVSSQQPSANKIKGFLVIKSKIIGFPGTGPFHSGSDYAGSLRLHVNKKFTSKAVNSYSIEFEKIRRIENNSFRYYDHETNILYSHPEPVPIDFNEQSVYIELFPMQSSKKKLAIDSLAKGEELNLSGLNFIWKGSLVN
ncbi:MAG TPA: hypothetical protein PLU58_08900, partial [Saprospiraceae bacterium]|nr:hypothetical protein [Saprospiraceae bacterium]